MSRPTEPEGKPPLLLQQRASSPGTWRESEAGAASAEPPEVPEGNGLRPASKERLGYSERWSDDRSRQLHRSGRSILKVVLDYLQDPVEVRSTRMIVRQVLVGAPRRRDYLLELSRSGGNGSEAQERATKVDSPPRV